MPAQACKRADRLALPWRIDFVFFRFFFGKTNRYLSLLSSFDESRISPKDLCPLIVFAGRVAREGRDGYAMPTLIPGEDRIVKFVLIPTY